MTASNGINEMFYTYILMSKKDGRWYTGATDNLQTRLIEHNNNLVKPTRGRGPFSIIYYEACIDKHDAFAREKYLKSGMGKRYLKNRLKTFLSDSGVHPVRVKLPQAAVNSNRGFVALISVIIIFAILLVLATLIATSSFFTRFNVLDYENKKVSTALAEACAETAMVNLAKDKDFNPTATGDCVSVGDGCTDPARKKVCKICSIDPVLIPRTLGDPVTITVRAVYNGAYTNLQVQGNISSSNFAVTSWDEVPYSGPCIVP